MAITKSDLRRIELVINKVKDETKRSLDEALAEKESSNGSKRVCLLEGRIDGISRALNAVREEFEDEAK